MHGERVGGRNDRRAEEAFEGNRYFGLLIMLMLLWVYICQNLPSCILQICEAYYISNTSVKRMNEVAL